MQLLVSILVPAYNSQQWLADTLRSAVAQTWGRKEIIVVDDGSTDQTLLVARRFESKSVRVVTQENRGAAAARNQALTLSQGDYIQWLDADDLLAPDKIARQMIAAEQCQSSRVLLSSAFGQFMYRYYRTRFIPNDLWCDLSPVEWLLRKMQQNLYMQTATWLVSRRLSVKAGPWDERLAVDDDGEYFCRVLLASEGVRFVPQARVYYRVSGPGSLSVIGDSDRKLEAQWLSMQSHVRFIRSLEDSARVRAACVQYLQTSLIYFYPKRPDIVLNASHEIAELGGKSQAPRLSWKYSWIKTLFGWRLAKYAQLLLPRLRWTIQRSWDKVLFQIDERSSEDKLRSYGQI